MAIMCFLKDEDTQNLSMPSAYCHELNCPIVIGTYYALPTRQLQVTKLNKQGKGLKNN
jgi:hypothetical protein